MVQVYNHINKKTQVKNTHKIKGAWCASGIKGDEYIKKCLGNANISILSFQFSSWSCTKMI